MIDLLERLAVSSVAMTARALAETAGSEVTFLGWRTLVIVGGSSESMRLSELADRLGTSRPSASKLVHRMARRDLLALDSDPIDGRGLCVRLGADGARLREAVVERRRQLIGESLHGIELNRTQAANLQSLVARLDRWT